MKNAWSTLVNLLRVASYRRIALGIGTVYLVLFLIALRDITLGGSGVQFATVAWTRMFSPTSTFTFEAIARLTLPGVTVLIAPLNILIGGVLSLLAALNLMVTYVAYNQPSACSFNRSTGVLASLPALLAGGACCAPAIVLILGLQVSSLFITAFQVLIPVAAVLLLITLKLILDRTHPERLSLVDA